MWVIDRTRSGFGSEEASRSKRKTEVFFFHGGGIRRGQERSRGLGGEYRRQVLFWSQNRTCRFNYKNYTDFLQVLMW